MGRIASALFCLLALPLCAQEGDVVTLKDGTTRSGRILSESETQIVIETLIKGSKGQVVGKGKVTIDRANVAKVERASGEAQKKAGERSEAFSDRDARRREALARLQPMPIEFEGTKGNRIVGAQFILDSSCDVAFTKDVALSLDEVFAAYRKYFDIHRNADRKVKVFLLGDRDEYTRFQTRRFGGAILNPAFYDPKENYIAAFNMIQHEEERRVRTLILKLEGEIEQYRRDLAALDRQVRDEGREIRRKLDAEVARVRSEIRAYGGGQKGDLLADLRRQEKEVLESIQKQEEEIQKRLQEERKKAAEAIDRNRDVIEKNRRILEGQNREMFELLYHEGFHAFATNYLWEGSAQKEFPRWLHEGMASYFEMSVVEGGELIHGAPHPEFHTLIRERRGVSLDKLIAGGPQQFHVTHRAQAARSTAFYAQSWALAHYVASRATREQIAAYVGEVLSGQDGVKAFEKMMGRRCHEVDEELWVYIDRLKTP